MAFKIGSKSYAETAVMYLTKMKEDSIEKEFALAFFIHYSKALLLK